MNRRAFVTGLGAVLAALVGVEAQQAPKPARVAMVCGVRCDGPMIDEFWQTLRELGRVDGQNLVRDIRGAGGPGGRVRAPPQTGPTVRQRHWRRDTGRGPT